MEKKYIIFMNVRIDIFTKKEILEKIDKFIKSKNYHYQISLNVAKLVYAQRDVKLSRIINESDLVTVDGLPIYLITSKISKNRLERMGGLDFMNNLAKIRPEYRYYFLGAEQKVLEKVVIYYKKRYNMNVVGCRNGYYKKDEINDLINAINKSKADILFIAMGTSKKEHLLYDFKDKLKVKFAVGVGGAFDIIAGKTKRAPKWIQNIGLEWFFRMAQEPKRMWKRYFITNTLFFYYLFKMIFTSRLCIFRDKNATHSD
ncbi:N-acetylglucosaminyldiphosphoundecaprenol N-acetyl-beta-D-mannosaminyltransferase [subsurface metagenome]